MNLPNALSLFRVILVPVYLCVFFSGMPHAHLIAAAVFLLAGLTDILDGRIARKYNQITLLGRILDPLADKLMVTSALVSLSMAGMIPAFVSVVYICKEILLSLGGVVVYRFLRDMPPSNFWGKASTTLFYVAIIGTIVFSLPAELEAVLFGAALLSLLAALSSYGIRSVKLLKENKHR